MVQEKKSNLTQKKKGKRKASNVHACPRRKRLKKKSTFLLKVKENKIKNNNEIQILRKDQRDRFFLCTFVWAFTVILPVTYTDLPYITPHASSNSKHTASL